MASSLHAVATTRVRVRHLLDDPLAAEPPPLLVWGCIALLGALSWTIA
jgi:hypothetical protein